MRRPHPQKTQCSYQAHCHLRHCCFMHVASRVVDQVASSLVRRTLDAIFPEVHCTVCRKHETRYKYSNTHGKPHGHLCCRARIVARTKFGGTVFAIFSNLVFVFCRFAFFVVAPLAPPCFDRPFLYRMGAHSSNADS